MTAFLLLYLATSHAHSAQSEVTGVLDRLAAFAKAHTRISVDFVANEDKRTFAKGALLLDRNHRMLFTTKWGPSDYSLSITEKGLVDIEVATAMYDEQPYTHVGMYPSKISKSSLFIPPCLLVPDVRNLFPKTAHTVYVGKKAEGGVSLETIKIDFPTQAGTCEFTISADSEGQILTWRTFTTGMMGNDDKTWNFSNLKSTGELPVSRFVRDIPNGYVPFSVPKMIDPVTVGDKVPVGVWSGKDGNQALQSLMGGKKAFIAILGTDCDPSKGAIASLAHIGKGVHVITLTNAGSASAARQISADALFDPTGKVLAAFHIGATPTFFLVDGSGKVTNAWMGYDPDAAATFETEVSDALKDEPVKKKEVAKR